MTSTGQGGGISSQPYRSYLTDRNHFYHSAAVPNPAGQISSISANNTVSYSAVPQSQQNSPVRSLNAKNDSHTSLNSGSSLQKMTKRSSTTSSTLPIDSERPYPKHYDEDDEDIDSTDGQSSGGSACVKCFYYFLWILAQFALFGAVGLLVYWMLRFDKGFAYQNDRRKQFNLHSFLMLTGFVFVNGQSMLIYKTYLCCKKIYNKIAHAFFFVLSIALVAFGLLIGFQAQHSVPPEQAPVHFYSLHSWIGLAACGLFVLQFVFGFFTFLVLLCCERGTAGFRARILPLHVTFGLVIFILACAACLTGLLQTARSRLSGPTITDPTKPDYKDMSIRENNPLLNAGLVINGVGGCIIFLAILIPVLVRNFNHNRRPETGASFRINH